MRSPLQGGLLPAQARVGPVVEIACDESGFSGTNLLRSTEPVVTHAGVDLSAGEAVGLIDALRSGFRVSPHEFKSGQLIRRSGEALEWFLAALTGRAQVTVVDKEFFLVTRILDLFLAEPSYAAGTRLSQEHRPAALALYRSRRTDGNDWSAFLAAFVDLVRTRRRHPDREAVRRFLQARDSLVCHELSAPAAAVLDELSPRHVGDVLTRLDNDDRSIPPPLEPLLPALAETILSWSAGTRQVLVTHDEQSALTADRLTRLQQALAVDGAPADRLTRVEQALAVDGAPADRLPRLQQALGVDGAPGGQWAALPSGVSPLAGLTMVDSRDDPRVQVADLLAGVARRTPAMIPAPMLSPTSLHDPDGHRPVP